MKDFAIQTACEIVGGQTALARLIGIATPTVNQWVKQKRPIPAERCPTIEKATNGAVRCEDLRPDVDWAYLRATNCQAKNGLRICAACNQRFHTESASEHQSPSTP